MSLEIDNKLEEITNFDLRRLCSKNDLPQKGGKREMYDRLKAAGVDPFSKPKKKAKSA